MNGCKAKVRKREDIIQKVLPGPDASKMKHYLKAVRGLLMGSRVELLIKSILEDIQLLASNHGTKTVTKDEMERLTKAINEIEKVPSSADDELVSGASLTNIYHGDSDHTTY